MAESRRQRLLGFDHVPTVRLAHLNAAQRRAYVLADNKLALNSIAIGWTVAVAADRPATAARCGAPAEIDVLESQASAVAGVRALSSRLVPRLCISIPLSGGITPRKLLSLR
jgi:hypothetical protein